MRRLGLLAPVSLCLLAPACAKDNPAFDDCETDASCVGESGAPGDGDGDTGDGDGDTGDGDGEPGDGDTGDGDTGDGEAGDGDGDPSLPSCPDSAWVDVPVLYDTFLDGTQDQAPGCVVDWDFNINTAKNSNNLAECGTLNFGASLGHWACSTDGCNSLWLGKFALEEWMGAPVQVEEARFEFTAKYQNFEVNTALAYQLDAANVDFGECLEWHAGNGQGDPPTDCDTTFQHAAHPHLWPLVPNNQMFQGAPIAAANLAASGDGFAQHTFVMPVDPTLVQGWLNGEVTHYGVLLNSTNAWLPTEFFLYAQGSGKDPKLQVRLCVP